MQLVINIGDNFYKRAMVYKGEQFPDNDDLLSVLITAVNNGVSIPKGHKVIDAWELQEHLALVPMEDRTYREAVEIIDRFPSIIEVDRSEADG